MYRALGEGRLSTGEAIELGVVQAPDADWADRIAPFLIHKGGDWNYHIRLTLSQPLDGLETRFYVGHVGGQPIAHVTSRSDSVLRELLTDRGFRLTAPLPGFLTAGGHARDLTLWIRG